MSAGTRDEECFAEVGACEQRRNFIRRGERLLVDEQIFDFAECHARPQARPVPDSRPGPSDSCAIRIDPFRFALTRE